MGEGSPLIILHGLYGSSDNWLNIAKKLADRHTVYLLDQRNHGRSPHSDTHTYPAMRDDLLEFMNQKGIDKATLLGHSMGGKTALYFSLAYPERVNRLIVVDIAPTGYPQLTDANPQALTHLNITNALYNLDTAKIQTLKEADQRLAESIPYMQVRQFLLKNLKRDKESGAFRWMLNVKAIRDQLPAIMDGMNPDEFDDADRIVSMPVMFIKGEKSPYIREEHFDAIRKIFPRAHIQTIEGAGHWVHAEKREEFLRVVGEFLGKA
jgi:pimeloyl-ACP methyl ester carboxylesterase